jgi:hypothetical protein
MLNIGTIRKVGARLSFVLALAFLFSISAHAQTNKKADYAILVDNTGSMRTQFREVLTIAEAILDHISDQATISIYNFKTESLGKNHFAVITSGVAWSQDKVLLKQYVSKLAIVPGQTTLLDAVASVANDLNARDLDGGVSREKVVFLITDGEERASKIKEKQLLQELTESNIKVNTFGMVKELDKETGFTRKSPQDKALRLIGRIGKETGGRSVFSRSKKDDILSLLNEMFSK